jgi:hypothetical protein
MSTLKRLLSPEYLAVTDPGPLGSLWILYLALGLLFATGLAAALWVLRGPDRKSRPAAQRAWAWFELWICLAGLGTVVGRFLGWPGWSARIWPYSLAALALVGALAYRLRRAALPSWLEIQFRFLAFAPPSSEKREPGEPSAGVVGRFRPGYLLLLLALHLSGTGLVLAARYGWPLWAAPLVLLVLLLPQALLLLYPRPSNLQSTASLALLALSPLLLAYGATLLWLLYLGLDITVIGWQGLVFPNPMASIFYVDGVVLAAVACTLLCQLYVTSKVMAKPAILWQGAVAGLLVVTLAWAGVVYFGKRTHGATASDPYAYAQMGVDLAERGTFLHRYSLFEEVIPLDIAWAPLQPVGYHITLNDQGDCPSVWATGASVLLAAGYKLLGEVGLYVTTPLVALLSLAATWALVQETLRGQPRAIRYLTGALAVALLATSPEHVDRLLVPMADAATQLFTILTLLFTLRAMRHQVSGKWRLGNMEFALAGICFAWAYWVRHTQLVLALPLILAVWLAGRKRQVSNTQSLISVFIFFATALLAALPDIVYRWRVFGSPLATETTELHLMRLNYIGEVAWQMVRDALVAGEWGYLFPLALYGGYRLARERRRETLVLGSAFVVILLVHLTYRSLRLRDLISLFPLVDLAVAYGAVALVQRVRAITQDRMARLGAALLPAATVGWIILSLALSRWAMIDNLWKPGWASFGYMRAEHRAAFDRLAELTPPEGIVGASLNAGAVMMYSDRDAIRPYDSWTEDEWSIFLQAMRAKGRPIYLLDDGGLMAEFIAEEKNNHRLTPIEALAIPLFYTRDRETGWLYRLEWDHE